MAFLVGHNEGSVRIQTDAIGGAEAGGKDVSLGAIGRNAKQGPVVRHQRVFGVACGLSVIEVALVIGLEAHGELVEVLGDLVVVVEALDVINRFVTIQVVKSGQLIAAGDVDLAVYDLETERLEEAGADAFPLQGAFELVDAFHDPNITHPCADCGTFAIGIEIKTAGAHPRLMRVQVLDRNGEGIHHESAGFVSALDFGSDDSGRGFSERVGKEWLRGYPLE